MRFIGIFALIPSLISSSSDDPAAYICFALAVFIHSLLPPPDNPITLSIFIFALPLAKLTHDTSIHGTHGRFQDNTTYAGIITV
jgi:hypothetical protein